MTMVRLRRRSLRSAVRAATVCLAMVCWSVLVAPLAHAQNPGVHYQHQGILPPGAIGRMRLQQGGPLSGYYQPVKIRTPDGVLIAPAARGTFLQPQDEALLMGLHIGSVYRFKVTRIPKYEGFEVYPSLEVIDRLYPPSGQKWRFPIPIDITQSELELAINGKYVTRVIYLENPNNALPLRQNPDEIQWFEASPSENPLEVADRLGRPVAILRIGGRLPGSEGASDAFLFGSPGWTRPRTSVKTEEVQ